MSESSKESFDELAILVAKADLEYIVPRLLLFTIHLLEQYDLPRNRAEEYVIRAFTSVLEGKYSPKYAGRSLFRILARTVALLVREDADSTARTA